MCPCVPYMTKNNNYISEERKQKTEQQIFYIHHTYTNIYTHDTYTYIKFKNKISQLRNFETISKNLQPFLRMSKRLCLQISDTNTYKYKPLYVYPYYYYIECISYLHVILFII